MILLILYFIDTEYLAKFEFTILQYSFIIRLSVTRGFNNESHAMTLYRNTWFSSKGVCPVYLMGGRGGGGGGGSS